LTEGATSEGGEPPKLTMPSRGSPDRVRTRLLDVIAIAALLVLGIAIPLILDAIAGSLLVPHNDDPSIRRAALGLYETGRLELNGWTTMTLVGQLLFVQPFLWAAGGGQLGFAVATATTAAVGIVGGYLLVRPGQSVSRALLAMLGIVLCPGFLVNTTTFMTDVPAWAMATLSLALGAAALNRPPGRRWPIVVASLAVGCFAFSIREFAVAAPAAVLVAVLASDPGGARRAVAAGLVMAAGCVAIYLFAHSLPGQHESPPEMFASGAFLRVGRGFATLALVLAPALVLAIATWWRRWLARDAAIGAVIGLVCLSPQLIALVTTRRWPRMLLGNLLDGFGVLGNGALPGERPVLFRAPSWDLLNAVALVSAIVLFVVLTAAMGAVIRGAVHDIRTGSAHRVLDRVGTPYGMLATFSLAYGVGMGAWGMVVIMFDRYLWMLVLPMYALLLMRPVTDDGPAPTIRPAGDRRLARVRPLRSLAGVALPGALSAALLVGLAATSGALLLNADAFEAARWRMGERAMAMGYQATAIDAGLEWVSYHATGIAAPYATTTESVSRYVAWWPPTRVCAVASSSPLHEPGLRLIATDRTAYRMLLFAGSAAPLYLYARTETGCP